MTLSAPMSIEIRQRIKPARKLSASKFGRRLASTDARTIDKLIELGMMSAEYFRNIAKCVFHFWGPENNIKKRHQNAMSKWWKKRRRGSVQETLRLPSLCAKFIFFSALSRALVVDLFSRQRTMDFEWANNSKFFLEHYATSLRLPHQSHCAHKSEPFMLNLSQHS